MHNKAQSNAKRRRAKGTGCLILRGSVWYGKWRKNGIPHVESSGIRVGDRSGDKGDREMAEEWLLDRTEPLRARHREDAVAMMMRQLMTQEERIAAGLEETRRRMTMGELEQAFRDSPRRPDCSADMLERYCGVIRRASEALGAGIAVADVDEDAANAYAASMKGSTAAGTYNKALNALTLAWKTCGREAGVAPGENPWVGIARRRLDVHVRRVLTRQETDMLIARTDGEMRRLVAICLYTGLRLGDACLFRWDDVRDGTAFVLTAKRDRRVAIPMHPQLVRVLGRPRKRGFVVPGLADAYARRNGSSVVSRAVSRAMKACGITTSVSVGKKLRMRPDATAHSLRHTFVTRAIEAGVPPHAVQQIVGHASAAMTEHYTHLSDQSVLVAFSRMQ